MASLAPITGNLEHPIDIKKPTYVKDSMGNNRVTYTIVVAGVYAAIEPLSGRERERAAAVDATVDHKIYMHYCDGIRPDQQVHFGSRIFNVRWVENPKNRNVTLILYTTEVFEDM